MGIGPFLAVIFLLVTQCSSENSDWQSGTQSRQENQVKIGQSKDFECKCNDEDKDSKKFYLYDDESEDCNGNKNFDATKDRKDDINENPAESCLCDDDDDDDDDNYYNEDDGKSEMSKKALGSRNVRPRAHLNEQKKTRQDEYSRNILDTEKKSEGIEQILYHVYDDRRLRDLYAKHRENSYHPLSANQNQNHRCYICLSESQYQDLKFVIQVIEKIISSSHGQSKPSHY